jgi:iron complex outermembrane recepter protein
MVRLAAPQSEAAQGREIVNKPGLLLGSVPAVCTLLVVAGQLTAVPAIAGESRVIEEIVVQAQRRTERTVDVPLTITHVTGEQLLKGGIDATNGLGQIVPAFRLDYNGAFAQPTIRGVSTALANAGGGSAVGVYVDGFYNASPLTSDFELLNVESIQVLKGPQGTLFGRNTTAGAVLVNTRDPSQETAIRLHGEYSRFNTYKTALYATTGLTDNVAVDLALDYKAGDGFFRNLTDGDDKVGEHRTWHARAGIMWEGENASVKFRYSHHDRDDPISVNWSVYQDKDGSFQTAAFAFGIPDSIWGRDRGELAADPGFTPAYWSEVDAYQLTFQYDLGWADLTSYTQYRDEASFHDIEVDNTNIPIFRVSFNSVDELTTQELLLNSKPGGKLDWVAGVFYMKQEAGQPDFTIETPAVGTIWSNEIEIISYAAYFDATWHLSDNLGLTLGARYSEEENDGFWDCRPIGLAIGFCPDSDQVDTDSSDFSPRVSLAYSLSDRSNVYATIARGYKAALVNLNGFQVEPIDAEELLSYEVGYKTLGAATRFEASAFYYDYQDLQVSTYVGTQSITTNAATSEVYGAELSVAHYFSDAFSANLGVAYTHGRYDEYLEAPANRFDYTTGLSDNSPTDVSGNRMIRSPDWTGNLALDYTTNALGGTINLHGNAYYSSKLYFDAANNNEQGNYSLINLRATWSPADARFAASVFANNVTDEKYITQVLPNGPGTGVSWGFPRMVGISMTYDY